MNILPTSLQFYETYVYMHIITGILALSLVKSIPQLFYYLNISCPPILLFNNCSCVAMGQMAVGSYKIGLHRMTKLKLTQSYFKDCLRFVNHIWFVHILTMVICLVFQRIVQPFVLCLKPECTV